MQPLSFLDLPSPPDSGRGGSPPPPSRGHSQWRHAQGYLGVCTLLLAAAAWGHGVAEGDAAFLQSQPGLHLGPYLYLGAKHMVTGYDHLAFLAGIVFFLYRLRDVGIYVTLFAIGHSLTLLAGVMFDMTMNVYLVDMVIGLSVVYKAFENLGGWQSLGWQLDSRIAVWLFGLCHGMGLATKLQELSLSPDGLLGNLLAFNLGVEIGQLLALLVIITFMQLWRHQPHFLRQATIANVALMGCGFLLAGYQLTGYLVSA